LIKGAIKLKVFDIVEGKRLLNELIHMLNEKNPLAPLTVMAGYGILEALHPSLTLSPKTLELIEAVSGVLSWWRFLFLKDKLVPWWVYFLALTDTLNDEDFETVLRRFSITGWQAADLRRERVDLRQALALFARGQVERPSEIVLLLRKFSMEAILFMMAKTAREQTRMALSDYINTLRHVKPLLRGKDLIAMGYEPGPIFTSILRATRDARLNGEIVTEEDERSFVRKRFRLNAHQEGRRGENP